MVHISHSGRFRSGQALYAIPDCDAVLQICPDAFQQHLTAGAAADRIRNNRGLVPVAIDPSGEGRVFWADMGQYPLRESKHLYSFKRFADQGCLGETFCSGMSILDDEALFGDGLLPAGLIFHISRCGSTLTTKALARPEGNVMISQGGPLQRGFWAHHSDDWRRPLITDARTLTRLRSLIFALTRRRIGTERRAFVKFISWNVLYLDVVARALPGIPVLFLYRDPAEVIATIKKETTAALLARGSRQASFLTGMSEVEMQAMDDTAYLATCYAHYLSRVLYSSVDVACVNYRDLNADTFSRVVKDGLDYAADEQELGLMREQFIYDSKDDAQMPRSYNPAQETPLSILTPLERNRINRKCGHLVVSLDRSRKNLFACEAETPTQRVREASA